MGIGVVFPSGAFTDRQNDNEFYPRKVTFGVGKRG